MFIFDNLRLFFAQQKSLYVQKTGRKISFLLSELSIDI